MALGSGAGPYPPSSFAPQPLGAFSTQSFSSLHRRRECPNGGGKKKPSQSRLTDLKRSQEFEDRGLVLFSLKILHMSYLYIKQNPLMCNPN